MKKEYNKKKIILFYGIITPLLILLGTTIYFYKYQLTGLILSLIGIVFYIFHKDHAAFIYYRRYDLSMQFHTQDIDEIEKYGYQDYEKLKSDSIKTETGVHKLISFVAIISGLMLFFKILTE